MSRDRNIGKCDKCASTFEYHLIHNGFNDSAYAYSDSDSYVAILSGWTIPEGIELPLHQPIVPELESSLLPSPDGGRFTAAWKNLVGPTVPS